MIKRFVDLLSKRIDETIEKQMEHLGFVSEMAPLTRERMVGKNQALREVKSWIAELYKADEDQVDDSDEGEVTMRQARAEESEETRTRRRRRAMRGNPRGWGTEE